ncbi:hypothetical protein BJ878DRAFT_501826 [Calycina marina]|uniref:Pre-mRNA-splicing factor 38B n=1 Tax=Calycina marina TaxID=1763456 RepID=A0A9P7Z4X5_9HELO|nr:hypothetical protein BJ878DRAFT_501826 [Calycina marina]
MPATEPLTDEYVVTLLAKDAKESSIRYSALGLEGLVPSKPPANKPKPNTRFLRNIIRDTDSHNAALLAKEAADSRARLAGLSTNEHRSERASRLGGGDIRRRQLGNIASILGGESQPSKRKKREETNFTQSTKRRASSPAEDVAPELKKLTRGDIRQRQLGDIADILGGKANRKHQKGARHDTDGKHSRRANTSSDEESYVKSGDRGESRRKDDEEDRKYRISDRSAEDKGDSNQLSRRRRHRNASETRGPDDHKHRGRKWKENTSSNNGCEGRRSRSCSRSPREHRQKESRYKQRPKEHRLSRSPERHRSRSSRPHHMPQPRNPEIQDAKEDYDSDPLDDLIGPRPPPAQELRFQGRGTISHGAGMDSRFSASYDPTVDVQLDPDEEDDWDQALEALRDRQKLAKQGAERLRNAGFAEEIILNWEKGNEKREEDLKWSKRGEGREWDRGKVLDEDGIVRQEASWGRLKGT